MGFLKGNVRGDRVVGRGVRGDEVWGGKGGEEERAEEGVDEREEWEVVVLGVERGWGEDVGGRWGKGGV